MKIKSIRNCVFIITMMVCIIITIAVRGYTPVFAADMPITFDNTTPVSVQTFQGIGGDVFSTLTLPSGTEIGFTDGDFQLFKARTKKMGLSFVRTWCFFNWWYQDHSETFESYEMQALYKQLYFYDSINCDVLLNLLPHFSILEYETDDNESIYPEIAPDPDFMRPGVDPSRLDKWATECKNLIQYIHDVKGIKSVKYITLFNEPNLFYDEPYLKYTGMSALAAVYKI